MTVRDLLTQAASQYGDPRMTRISLNDWLDIYNAASEHVTIRWQTLEQDATFDILANESRYTYPDDMVQLRRVQFSETPSDDTIWREIPETWWDQFRVATDLYLPQNVPFRYCVRANFFELTPRPTTKVLNGGKVAYWKLADTVDDADTDVELGPVHRKTMRDLMVIYAKERRGRAEEANRELAIWTENMDTIAKKIEHRADDRKPALHLRSRASRLRRML
jgi:hypothetical protein